MLEQIVQYDKEFYMNTFGDRLPVSFTHGEGIKLYADNGDVYYDFLGGIAVNAIGHSHPAFKEALKTQIDKVLHTSSLYYIENQAKLAKKLVESTCADKAFFCNSGAEANEGAFKLAKIYFYKQNIDRYEILSLDHSFHGRTLATVAATGQRHYQAPYEPLTPGFKQIEPNSIEAVKEAITPKTAAIIVELVQGESGVHPMDVEYAKALRKLCDDEGILLIVDEVQTGVGRTGKLFAHELYGIEPDIFTCAKALGGGIPIGAVCAKAKVAAAFEPGDHGTTFGGNPFATAAGLAVLDIMEKENLVENSRVMGEVMVEKLRGLQKEFPDKIKDVRGVGLLVGVEVAPDIAKAVFNGLHQRKILTSLCKGLTIRVAPPLNITEKEIDIYVSAFRDTLNSL